MDREKVVKAVKTAFDVWIDEYTGCSWFKEDEVRKAKEDALVLLEKQEEQKFFVDESGKITPLPVVVLCKDCKQVTMFETVDGQTICECDVTRSFHKPDWFCADGEREEGDEEE